MADRWVKSFFTYHLAVSHRSRVFEKQEPSSASYSSETKASLFKKLNELTDSVTAELTHQGFDKSRIKIERMLNMRFAGTDTALMVLPEANDGDGEEDFEAAFKRTYKAEFGFLLEGKLIDIDDIKVYLISSSPI